MNNLSVIELRTGNFPAALVAAKRALAFIEKDLLNEINERNLEDEEPAFLERL